MTILSVREVYISGIPQVLAPPSPISAQKQGGVKTWGFGQLRGIIRLFSCRVTLLHFWAGLRRKNENLDFIVNIYIIQKDQDDKSQIVNQWNWTHSFVFPIEKSVKKHLPWSVSDWSCGAGFVCPKPWKKTWCGALSMTQLNSWHWWIIRSNSDLKK